MLDDPSVGATCQALSSQLAIFQALLLAASAAHKTARWGQSMLVVQQFAAIPRSLAAPALTAVLAMEVAAGVLLSMSAHRMIGAALAALIWSVYLAFIVRAIVQDRREIDCGCSFGSTSRPLGFFHVARNAALAAIAVLIAADSAWSGSVGAQPSQILGGMAFLALYGALDQVMALRPLRSGEIL